MSAASGTSTNPEVRAPARHWSPHGRWGAQDDIVFCGERVNLTVSNIQALPGVGPRIPAIGDEIDDAAGNAAPNVKTMAFVLL
jgi:hypothetical protein